MSTVYDCRMWGEDDWDHTKNYIVIMFYVDDDNGKTIYECLQKLFDFANLEVLKELGITWEDKGSPDIGEVHGRYFVADDARFQSVCEMVQLFDGQGWYDNMMIIPKDEQGDDNKDDSSRESSGDDYREIHLIWDTDFTKQLASTKIRLGLQDETKMGEAWSFYERPDGTFGCLYVATSDEEFQDAKDRVERWKKNDRIAYSRAEFVDNRKKLLDVGKYCGDVKTLGKSSGTGLGGAKNGVAKPPAIKFYGDRENVEQVGDYVEPENSLLRLKYQKDAWPSNFGSHKKKGKKRYYTKMSSGTSTKQERKQKYRNLPPEPTDEYSIKAEKVFRPSIYAKRHDLYDKRQKSKYYQKWLEASDFIFTVPISNGLTEYSREKMFPIGEGKYFNGYYVLEKRDFYCHMKTEDDENPCKVVRYWGWAPGFIKEFPGCEDLTFPTWENYLRWYWRDDGVAFWEFGKDPARSSDNEELLYPGEYEMSDFSSRSSDGEFASDGTSKRCRANESVGESDPESCSGSDESSGSNDKKDGRRCPECGGLSVRKEMIRLKKLYHSGEINKRGLVVSWYCHCLAWPKESPSDDEQGDAANDGNGKDVQSDKTCMSERGYSSSSSSSDSENVVVARSMKNRRVLVDSESD